MDFRDLVTIAEVREATGWTVADYTDAAIQSMITDISALIESLTGHAFGYSADTEYTFIGDGTDILEFYGFQMPLAGSPSLVNGSAFDSTSYDLYPVSGGFHEELISRISGFSDGERITVTGDWGWSDIPSDVKYAAIRLIKRYAADTAWAALVSGTGSSAAKDIKKVDVGEGRASVTFGEQTNYVLSSRSTGDSIVDRIIRKYRRGRLAAVV